MKNKKNKHVIVDQKTFDAYNVFMDVLDCQPSEIIDNLSDILEIKNVNNLDVIKKRYTEGDYIHFIAKIIFFKIGLTNGRKAKNNKEERK